MTLALSLLLATAVATTPSPKEPRPMKELSGTAARIAIWAPHRLEDRTFEDGYRRHLEWHRSHGDQWTWHGWTVISGDRFGTFIDGTFFHPWPELDRPVSPAEDAADNGLNVVPRATLKLAAAVEFIPGASEFPAGSLASPLMTFAWISVAAGAGRDLEARSAKTHFGDRRRALFRPADGMVEYLMLVPASRTSDLPAVSEALQSWAREINAERPLIASLRVETARYREDLGYAPGTEARPAPAAPAATGLISAVAGLAPAPGYSYAAVPAGQLVFLAGQLALDERGAMVGKDNFEAQVRRSFDNLKLALAAAGCLPADVIKLNYNVVGLSPERLSSLRSVRDEFFSDPKPASTLVGVTGLARPEALFEVEAVAVRRR